MLNVYIFSFSAERTTGSCIHSLPDLVRPPKSSNSSGFGPAPVDNPFCSLQAGRSAVILTSVAIFLKSKYPVD